MSADLAVMRSSASVEWPTPEPFFRTLDAEFGFTLDPCATAENAKCSKFYTEEDDGLTQSWRGTVFCTPPYGRQIADWIKKAHDESRHGATVVMLIPARTETSYWHRYVIHADELRFVRGRMRFDGTPESGHNAPFASVVVIFRPESNGPPFLGPAISRDG